jgi:hypothetical protein
MTLHNTITHADCTKTMTGLAAASVDFVLTDPPYLIDYQDRAGRSVANDDNTSWLRPAFAQIYRVLKPASFCVSFYAWNRVHLFMAAWRDAGFRPVGHIVFRKRYASAARFLRYEHECAYLLAKGDVQPPAQPIPDVIEFRYTAPNAEADSGTRAAHFRVLSTGRRCARSVCRVRLDTGSRQATRTPLYRLRDRRTAPPHGDSTP